MARRGKPMTTNRHKFDMNEIVDRLKEFIENEMRSCSMDVGGISPEYVQRAWGGRVAIEDIEEAFKELKRNKDLPFIR